MSRPKKPKAVVVGSVEPLYGRIQAILAEARSQAWRAVNSAMVVAYWEVGRAIVEDEQHGRGRAEYGADLINELRRIEESLKERTFNPRFDPSHMTITVSYIDGGIAHNIIPPRCHFSWGIRAMPNHNSMEVFDAFNAYAAKLIPGMKAVHPDCNIETTAVGILPPFDAGEGSEARTLALKLAGQNETYAVPYGTEASHFQSAGCSTVVIGPGSIDQAHQPNEYLEADELDKCMDFLRKVADWAES